MADDCPFCAIVAGDIPATIVLDSANTLAFRDLTPQAPAHVLVIPKHHYETAAELAAGAPDVLVELHQQATAVAEELGIAETGYRMVYNTGRDAAQSVQHVHLHVLGGRSLSWPPG